MPKVINFPTSELVYPLYLSDIKRLKSTIKNLASKIAPYVDENVVFFGTGTSGAMMCVLLKAHFPDNFFVLVGKKNEKSHRLRVPPFFGGDSRFVFVDDCISSCNTLLSATRELKKHWQIRFTREFRLDGIALIIPNTTSERLADNNLYSQKPELKRLWKGMKFYANPLDR